MEKTVIGANEIIEMGFDRKRTYEILNRADAPVFKIGRRKFVIKEDFLNWLREQKPDKN